MAESLQTRVSRIVQATPVHDIHTHLYDPAQGEMLLWGIDELLVYHYLVSEASRQMALPSNVSGELPNKNRPPTSGRRSSPNIPPSRKPAAESSPHSIARHRRPEKRPVEPAQLVCCPKARPVHEPSPRDRQSGIGVHDELSVRSHRTPHLGPRISARPRFVAALRIDPLLVAWPETSVWLREQGYAVSRELTAQTLGEVRRFLADWTARIDSRYCMVSLPPSFAWPAETEIARLIEGAVLPHCRDQGQAFALMMGVKRAVNPRLRMAGDGVGLADLNALQALCAAHPENRFVVTCLARENQHELVVLARKFSNLHPFGCWWFTNTPNSSAKSPRCAWSC